MSSPRRGHELRDVSVPFFASVIVGLLLLTLIGMGVSLWYESAAVRRQKAEETTLSPLAQSLPQQPPEPRLQVKPGEDLQKFRTDEKALLSRYEWIDRETGIVRIPIDRAMELLADRGLPVRGAGNSTTESSPPKKERQ